MDFIDRMDGVRSVGRENVQKILSKESWDLYENLRLTQGGKEEMIQQVLAKPNIQKAVKKEDIVQIPKKQEKP